MNANQTNAVVAASAFAAGSLLVLTTITVSKKVVARVKQKRSNDMWAEVTDSF